MNQIAQRDGHRASRMRAAATIPRILRADLLTLEISRQPVQRTWAAARRRLRGSRSLD